MTLHTSKRRQQAVTMQRVFRCPGCGETQNSEAEMTKHLQGNSRCHAKINELIAQRYAPKAVSHE